MSTHQQAQDTTPEAKFVRPLPGPLAARVQAANQMIDAMRAPQEAPQEPPQEVAQEVPQEAQPPAQEVTQEAQPPAPKPDVSVEDWKARYESMRGRVRAYERQITEQTDALHRLANEVADLKAARTAPSEPAPEYLTEDERREYGSEFLSVVAKRAREAFDPIAQKYEEEIRRLNTEIENLKAISKTSALDKMYSYLNETVPDWRALNKNEDFLNWLERPDMFSGQTRMSMLKKAEAQNDAVRVAAFFKGYLQEAAAVAPQKQVPTEPVKKQVSLEKLAAPGRPMTAAPGRPADQPTTISRAQISQFYADKAAGKFRGKEREADAFEREIFEANRDGRIVN